MKEDTKGGKGAGQESIAHISMSYNSILICTLANHISSIPTSNSVGQALSSVHGILSI